MRPVNLFSSICLMLLGAFIIYETRAYPAGVDTLGPQFFPELLGGILVALAAAIFFLAIFRKDHEPRPAMPTRKITIITSTLVIYIVLLPIVGFLISTPAFFVISGLVLAGDVRLWWKKVCLSAVLTTGGMYFLFSNLLNVPLP